VISDQAARLAREPSIPALVKVKDTWINRRQVVALWWAPADSNGGKDGHTVIGMTGGHSFKIDAPLGSGDLSTLGVTESPSPVD